MGQGVAGDQGGDEQGRQCMNQAGGWGVGASQAGEHLKGLQRAAGKHWALLRAPLSPSDFHCFKRRHDIVCTLSSGHVTRTHIQPPAILQPFMREKGNQTEGRWENPRRGLFENLRHGNRF